MGSIVETSYEAGEYMERKLQVTSAGQPPHFVEDHYSQMYAGFWRRVAAFALDYVIILAYLLLLVAVGFVLNTLFDVNQLLFANRVQSQVSGFLLVTLPITLYFSLGESSHRRGTWGKAKVGVQVITERGERISLWRAVIRTVLKFIPWELSHTLVWTIIFAGDESPVWVNYGFILVYGLIGLNLASLALTRKRQAIYDLLTKTYVIKKI